MTSASIPIVALDDHEGSISAPDEPMGLIRQRLEEAEDEQSFYAYLMREPSYIL